jgi:hypothetical protein
MIASTDWQHYHSAAAGWKLDSLGIACIESLDADRLEKYLSEKKVEACGGAAAVAVVKAAVARGANEVRILKYGDSGDVSGDKSSVVGYLAAAIYRTDDSEKQSESGSEVKSTEYQLTDSEKQQLLRIARESIKAYLAGAELPEIETPAKLNEPGAAFVTLEKHGHLRGCIGYTDAIKPLCETVSSCAVSAAVRDHRFPPVLAEELDSLHIEISILTPLQRVDSPEEIEVGRDGLMITLGRHRGLLLPQVALEYGWDRDEFLAQTCRKAGLPPNAYQSPDATIYRFRALIFGEK